MKRHVYLSAKSREKCFEWSELRETKDTVADLYLSACLVIGNFPDRVPVEMELQYEASIRLRDSFGRMILKRIKAESRAWRVVA